MNPWHSLPGARFEFRALRGGLPFLPVTPHDPAGGPTRRGKDQCEPRALRKVAKMISAPPASMRRLGASPNSTAAKAMP